MASNKPELVAIYGRRRVGKTFTISQTLKENTSALYFEATGTLVADGRKQPLREFLADFSVAWYSCTKTRRAFRSAEDCLIALVDLSAMASRDRPLYLFLDELPWIARASPRFFRGLATLWNNTLSKNPCLKLFVAGSATSWMIDQVVQARTGLAKRVTAKIHMRPLDLTQTRQFLAAKGLKLSHNEVIQIYSALGGIPYYLDALDPGISPTENLYRLLVAEDGLLYAGLEYEHLFRYLFARDSAYRKVIDILVEKKYGLSYADLAAEMGGKEELSGGTLKILKNLERSEMIHRRTVFLSRSKGARLFVTDEYIRFVSRWLKDADVTTYAAFNRILSSQSYAAWQGFDFELTVFKNVHLITQALGISGISVEPFVFYQDHQVQIDLLLARADRTITICEAKSHDREYEPTADDVDRARSRTNAIRDCLKAKRKPEHFINHCFIVRNGIRRNQYFNAINPVVADLSTVL